MSKKWYNETRVMFSERRLFLGRNGSWTAIGINISSNAITTKIEPINSKNEIASCYIEIPTKDLDAFIESLKQVKFESND